MNREEIIKGLQCCNENLCEQCPYFKMWKELPMVSYACESWMHHDLLLLIEEQKKIIEKYHKADMFLEAHGWKWD